MPIARRGEIWLIDLGYAAKVRPALILSAPFEDHERALVTFVPRTTTARGTRFETEHRAPSFDPGVFDAQGISTVPDAKLVRKLGVLDVKTLALVETTLRRWLVLE